MKSISINVSTLIVVAVLVAMSFEVPRGQERTYSFMAEEFAVDISNRDALFSLL